jgi:hypothetical protein
MFIFCEHTIYVNINQEKNDLLNIPISSSTPAKRILIPLRVPPLGTRIWMTTYENSGRGW